MQSFLTDKEPKMVSDQGLMWLAKDVRWLVDHIKSLQNENLLDVFSELHQVRFSPSLPSPSSSLTPLAKIDITSPHFSSNAHFLPRSRSSTNSILKDQPENIADCIDQIDDLVQYESRIEDCRWEEERNDRGVIERRFGSTAWS